MNRIMRLRSATLLALWVPLALLPPMVRQARAAQVQKVQVSRDGQRFRIEMHISTDAAPAALFRALLDYASMPRYNPDLLTVRIESTSDPNRVRLFTTVHTCVLFFCKTMHQEQLMTASAGAHGGVLQAELVAEGSAFRGNGRWVVKPCSSRAAPACMDIQIVLEPQFWLPPVLGPWLIRRKMYEEAQQSSAGLEQMARSAFQAAPSS